MGRNYLGNLFAELETDKICVSDFGLVFEGARIDFAVLNEDGSLSLWAGCPNTGKHAEELVMDDKTLKLYCERIDEYIK